MEEDSLPSRNGIPYNPELGELIRLKRRGSRPPSRDEVVRGFRGWHERGYLPHRDAPGLTQFVTFREADSFPSSLRSEWGALLEIEEDEDRIRQLEAYLDRGRGSCLLRRPEIAGCVDAAIRFYHRRLFELRAWVVMPNHVHILLRTVEVGLSKIIAQLKRYTARRANEYLGVQGQFWAEDYWDTFMRDSEHERRTVRYIENNPTKPRLVPDPRDWPYSSARYRDRDWKLSI